MTVYGALFSNDGTLEFGIGDATTIIELLTFLEAKVLSRLTELDKKKTWLVLDNHSAHTSNATRAYADEHGL